jgi:hypothetical protein
MKVYSLIALHFSLINVASVVEINILKKMLIKNVA